MATKLSPCCSLARYALILVSLLTLVGILSGCGTSSVAGPSGHSSGLTNTSTSTHALKGTIREIPLPTHFSPSDLTTGPDGNLWLAGNQIGRITPTGVMREFSLPAESVAFRITTGPDGNLWFLQADKIGRITPAGSIREFPVPNRLSSVNGITAGPDGNLWFTEDTGNHSQNGKIGRITLTGTISEFRLPTPRGGPEAITGGARTAIWFLEANSRKIV